VDLIVRGRYAKRVNWRKGKRLGKGDRLVTMLRPVDASRVMSKRLWMSLPESITVRQIRVQAARPGFRSEELLLVTTLLDPKDWPAETLVGLYVRRWRVELNFDDIKTTMRASALRCQSPKMIRRELLMHAIAYNHIRRVMLESARQECAPLDQISFNGTLDTVRHWQHTIAAKRGRAARADALEEMLLLCASDLLLVRPGRNEPRAIKRRPKPYQYLTKPRRRMVVSPSRSNKGAARKPAKQPVSSSLN
jgi:hypothetical protein